MEALTSFLPSWKKVLTGKERKGRPAVLLLETVYRTEGIAGVSELARKWKNNQPQGYLYWLHILNNEKNQKEIITVSTEGLNAIQKGKFRVRIAEFMIDAAGKLNDSKHLLFGKREKFFSSMNDRNLLDLMDEATKQNKREKELHAVIGFFKTHNSINEDKKPLYIRTLLMLGQLKNAVDMVEKEYSVGWSYGSNAGVVFGAVLFVLSAYSEEASTIKTLLKGYADKESIYSGKISIDDGTGTSFYDEIIKGLKQNEDARSPASESLSWAEKIGGSRIEHIVSNKHRGAYERAAQVLGSLAEAYAAMGDKSKAVNILHKYYTEKYVRFSAFRREVKAIVLRSNLLRDIAL